MGGEVRKKTISRLMQPAYQIITAGVNTEQSYIYNGASLFTSAFLSAARGETDPPADGIISLDEIMSRINRQIDAKRAELGDNIKMTPHIYLSHVNNNAGEFFFLMPRLSAGGAEGTTMDAIRVGALGIVVNEVSYMPRKELYGADAMHWLLAHVGQTVTQGMSLKTGLQSAAAIRVGRDAISMSPETSLHIVNLSERKMEISAREGRIGVLVERLEEGEEVLFEIPRGFLWLLQPGRYEIEVGTADHPSRAAVFDGRARFVGGYVDRPVEAGEEVRVTGEYSVGTIGRITLTPGPLTPGPLTRSPTSEIRPR
jgi:hypothetical protein